jgi:hypothetical protein
MILQILQSLFSNLACQYNLHLRSNVCCVSYQLLRRSWYTDFDYSVFCFPNLEIDFMVVLIGRQRTITAPRHMIPPIVYPGVCVCLVTWSRLLYIQGSVFVWSRDPAYCISTGLCLPSSLICFSSRSFEIDHYSFLSHYIMNTL